MNLRIVLRKERKTHILEEPLHTALADTAPRAEQNAYKKRADDANDVSCLMLATMSSELKKQHENMDAYDMIEHLKSMFEGQSQHERYDTSKALYTCKQGEREPVGPHVLKMIGYIEYLEKLGLPIGPEAQIDLILQSLNNNYAQFVMNFNMNEIEKSLTELLGMLRTAEGNMKNANPTTLMLMVSKGNAKGKWKGKKKIRSNSVAKPNNPKQAKKPKGGFLKEGDCHFCRKSGHWKRNCHAYLE